MKLEHYLILYTKINSKWIKDLNVRPESIKLLEENIGRTLDDISQSKIFYDPPSRVMEIKTKISKWDLIKLKSFCTAQESTNKVKKQPSEWEKMVAKETTDKEFPKSQTAHTMQHQKKKKPNQKWAEDPDISPKETNRWPAGT